MKKFLIIILISIFCIIPVNAKSDIEIENIKYVKSSDGVVSNNKEQVNVIFNDLNQTVNYEAVIKNNTDQKLYVNSLESENSKEKFIEYKLDSKSENMVLEPNSSAKILFKIKTLEIEGAGRNLDEQIKVNFLLSDKITNPNTFSNIIDLIILLSVLVGTMYLVRKNKKVQTLILILGISTVGIYYVDANDYIKASLDGNIKYTSQNNIIASGTTLNGKQADYTNSKEVWAYYDKVKNVEVKSLINEPKDYYKKFDLTENKTGRVMAYLVENNDKDTPYDLKIMSKGVVIANKDSSFMFSFPKTEKVEGLTNVDFNNTESMQGMFIGNEKVEELEVSAIPLDNVKNTSYMFYENKNLDVTIKDFNTEHIENIEDITYMTQNYLYDIVKKNAKSDKDMNYQTSLESGNFYFSNSTENKPIYYYRGNVNDNNVKFANFCWLIVRTTDEQGIKLLYNGIPDENGNCIINNPDSHIGVTKYNGSADSLGSAGYMYGAIINYGLKSLTNNTNTYLYGNDVEYDVNTNTYKLVDTIKINDWQNNYKQAANKHNYTCFNESGECTSVYYIVHHNKTFYQNGAYDKGINYITLSDGQTLNSIKELIVKNTHNSSVKNVVDKWYENNLKDYNSMLEDSVWCNDRTIRSGSLSDNNYDVTEFLTIAYSKERIINGSPNLLCSNKNDSFTVDENNGNGALIYPIGLLTADEVLLMGGETETKEKYFENNNAWWLMTPAHINNTTSYLYRYLHWSQYQDQTFYGGIYSAQVGVSSGTNARPAITLKEGTQFVRGTGSYDNPYIIEKIEK